MPFHVESREHSLFDPPSRSGEPMPPDDDPDELSIYFGGDLGDRYAFVHVPLSILTRVGIEVGQSILLQVSDSSPAELELLGSATSEGSVIPYMILAKPNPNDPLEFAFQFPETWLDKHWTSPEEKRFHEEGPYRLIHADFSLREATSLLKADSTMVIPLQRSFIV